MKSPSRQVVNRDIKTSMNLLLRQDNPQKGGPASSNYRRVIKGAADLICRQLEVIGWRYKTSLPIVRPVSYLLLQFPEKTGNSVQQVMKMSFNDSPTKGTQSQVDTKVLIDFAKSRPDLGDLTVQVVIESLQCRLSDIGCLPFGQIIYLLKEMMIGYDVLLDIFGCFQPNDEMIAVSSNSQWRVWLNEDFTLNTKPEKSSNIGQKELIYKLIFIAEKHCTPTTLSKTFFAEIKEFTYSKECSFIKTLQKIKDFVAANKIFQLNKVIIAQKKGNDSTVEEPKKQFTLFNQNNSLNNIRQRKVVPFAKPKVQTSGFLQFQCKSTSNLMDMYKHNTSAMLSPTNPPQRNMNTSTIQYRPPNYFPPHQQGFPTNIPMQSSQSDSPTYQRKNMNQSVNLEHHLSFQRRSNFYPNFKPLSPPALPLQTNKPIAVSKSRLQLKALVNAQKSQSPKQPEIVEPLTPPPVLAEEKKPQKKPARKYSEQIIKVKSLQALTSKKFAGSNIYMNDPETKVAVNVIKQPQLKPKVSLDCSAEDSKLLSPNYSSPSTRQVKDSKEGHRGQDKYLSLKMNDLGCKLRNNMSSYYGMGGKEEKRDKNMAVSYNFHNKNQDNSSQSSQNTLGNNWTRKISGLFSDDASIKHLKGSVKFKTEEEQLFEKQYLKDVKLQMLEKFGRPVRHSIVDQEDDFEPHPYKSMQLIEEVFEDGKSHFEEKQEQEEETSPPVRRRNQTVQITLNKQEVDPIESNKKECISEYCQSEEVESDGGFNFQTEAYVINPKR